MSINIIQLQKQHFKKSIFITQFLHNTNAFVVTHFWIPTQKIQKKYIKNTKIQKNTYKKIYIRKEFKK